MVQGNLLVKSYCNSYFRNLLSKRYSLLSKKRLCFDLQQEKYWHFDLQWKIIDILIYNAKIIHIFDLQWKKLWYFYLQWGKKPLTFWITTQKKKQHWITCTLISNGKKNIDAFLYNENTLFDLQCQKAFAFHLQWKHIDSLYTMKKNCFLNIDLQWKNKTLTFFFKVTLIKNET
jgi:hypothetical protein